MNFELLVQATSVMNGFAHQVILTVETIVRVNYREAEHHNGRAVKGRAFVRKNIQRRLFQEQRNKNIR